MIKVSYGGNLICWKRECVNPAGRERYGFQRSVSNPAESIPVPSASRAAPAFQRWSAASDKFCFLSPSIVKKVPRVIKFGRRSGYAK
jgi:hypothetical protein